MDAIKQDGQWIEHRGEPLPLLDGGVGDLYQVPPQWTADEKRVRFGLYIVAETPVPPGKHVVSYSLVDDGGAPRKVDALADIPPPSAAELLAHAAERRWRAEIGGTTWSGWAVATDRESQAKIIAERLAIEAGERADPDGWKFADGVFRMIGNAGFVALSNAVRGHVRACFALEAQVRAAIEEGAVTSFEAVDAAGWPNAPS